MTSREQFEKWFKSDYHPDKSGPYLKDALFLAWQASRAEIEIVMPEPFQMANSTSGLSYYYEKEVDDAIRLAGINLKDC